MTPTAKLNTAVSSFTVLVMFWAVRYVAPAITTADNQSAIVLAIGGLLTTAGVYRVIFLAIKWTMERSSRVRALMLGPFYMHGTWVGWFVGHAGDRRFMVEHFDQDLESIAISGRSFTAQGAEHGYWLSDSVNIDARKGRLVFTYSFDVLTNSISLAGVHTSSFERTSSRHAPQKLSGFAHDLNDPTRIVVHSEKISDELLSWDEALKIAQQRF